jgi:arsenite oxidase small subunit
MECSRCHRIWHVGEPQCPTCGSPAIEALQPKGELPPQEASARNEDGQEGARLRFSRRDFIIGAVAGGAAATVAVLVPVTLIGDGDGDEPPGEGPAASEPAVVLTTFPRQRIGSLSALKQGQPLDFEFPLQGQPNFLVKLGEPAKGGVGPDGDIVAFSYLCAHMGCPLIGQYKDEHKILGPCTCHFTTYDLRNNGMVVLGQATQSLAQISLAVEDDDVYATGVIGLVYGFRDNLLDAEPVEATS